MPPRFHTAKRLGQETQAILEGSNLHHIRNVLRMTPGDQITLFDGSGGEYEANIIKINSNGVLVELGKFVDENRVPRLEIILGLVMIKSGLMDLVVQKATELGVHAIYPLTSERCEIKLSGARADKKLQHWKDIAIGACQQCGMNLVPDTGPMLTVQEFMRVMDSDLKLIGQPQSDTSISDIDGVFDSITLIIGPEGGFNDKELSVARDHGFVTFCLGPRTLRAETASIAATVLCQSQFGDLQVSRNRPTGSIAQ